MAYFSERNGYRKPIEKTTFISVQMYEILFDCCEKYLKHLAWLYPEECPDGHGCYDINLHKLNTELKFEIPDLYRNYRGEIAKPFYEPHHIEDYDQYALLDYIEYIANNCRDFEEKDWHQFFGHTHIAFLDSSTVFETFKGEINRLFERMGLQYVLTDQKIIERVTDNQELVNDALQVATKVQEAGLKDLIINAIQLYKNPHPDAHRDAMEKIWDAFERLKSYYQDKNKRDSADKIVTDISGGISDYYELVNTEFDALTKIGNNYRIRHHETNKIEINDPNFYDYFFSRCLALISLAINYLEQV